MCVDREKDVTKEENADKRKQRMNGENMKQNKSEIFTTKAKGRKKMKKSQFRGGKKKRWLFGSECRKRSNEKKTEMKDVGKKKRKEGIDFKNLLVSVV